MKIFRPVDKMSTEMLLKALEQYFAASLAVVSFLAVILILLLKYGGLDPNQVFNLGFASALILLIFLVLHFYARKRLLPEFKKRLINNSPSSTHLTK